VPRDRGGRAAAIDDEVVPFRLARDRRHDRRLQPRFIDARVAQHPAQIRRVAVPGFAVLGVESSGNFYYVVSGSDGGVTQVSKATMAVTSHVSVADARALAINGNAITVLSGQTGTLNHFAPGTLTPLPSPSRATLPLGGLSAPYARASTTHTATWQLPDGTRQVEWRGPGAEQRSRCRQDRG